MRLRDLSALDLATPLLTTVVLALPGFSFCGPFLSCTRRVFAGRIVPVCGKMRHRSFKCPLLLSSEDTAQRVVPGTKTTRYQTCMRGFEAQDEDNVGLVVSTTARGCKFSPVLGARRITCWVMGLYRITFEDKWPGSTAPAAVLKF